jgi:hypothetical protein
LSAKTLTTPTIADFTNATHTHTNASGGGQINPLFALTTTGTPSSSTYLRGDNTWATISAGDVTTSGVQTLTNKRINPRIGTITSSATPAIDTDTVDQFTITALATNISSMSSSLSGTPVEGQKLIIRIKDNGTPRGISWGASWRGMGVTLPIVTTASKILYIGAVYNATDSIWDVIAVEQQV